MSITFSNPPASVISIGAGPASLTGTTSLSNIAIVAVPAGRLGRTGAVMLSVLWTITNSANNKTLAVIWSNTSGATTGGIQLGTNIVATTSATLQTMHIGRNINATNSQKSYAATPITPFGASVAAAVTGAVDTTLPSFLNINGTLALGTETITVEQAMGFVTFIA